MRSILTILAAASAFAALSFGTVLARADNDDEYNPIRKQDPDEFRRMLFGIGTSHIGTVGFAYLPSSVIDYEENETTPPISGTGLMQIGFAMLPLPTIFGSLGGFEVDITMGLPLFKSYFGGFGGSAGIILQPLSFKHFRASLALGAGFNAHGFGYAKPRIAFTVIPDRADMEITYRWIPKFASNVFGGREDDLEDPGFGEDRLRANLFIRVGAQKESREVVGATNLHIFFDYTRIAGDDEGLHRVRMRPGDYLGFGLGAAF